MHTHQTHKTMYNTELTLGQLQAICGGGRTERQAARAERREARQEARHHNQQFKWGIFCHLWSRPHDEDCPYNSSNAVPPAEECVPVENQ